MLSKAIIVTGCPFGLTEHPLWKEFFHHIRPSFRPPLRKTVSNRHLQIHYDEMKTQVIQKVANAECLHLQCDAWSNLRNESIINFIVNTPDPVFVKSVSSGAERHTSDYLYEEIKGVLEEFDKDEFFSIIGDNAANLQGAFQKISDDYLHIIALRCMAHVLNVLCLDILKLDAVSELLEMSNEMITHIRNSQILNALFQKRLPLHVKTRWGTVEKSLKALLDNQHALQTLAINPDAASMNVKVKRKF